MKPKILERTVVAYVDEGNALSVTLLPEGNRPPNQSVVGRRDLAMTKYHALILDSLISQGNRNNDGGGDDFAGLLREAVILGMEIQAKATGTQIVPDHLLLRVFQQKN